MSNFEVSKKKKSNRKLTPFLCREMLFDFAIGALDSARRAAVEEILKTDEECQRLLQDIKTGIDYTDRLSRATINEQLLKNVQDVENAMSIGRRYVLWSEWPDAFRWSVTAVVISSFLAGIVVAVPWNNLATIRSLLVHSIGLKRPDAIEVAQLSHGESEQTEEAVEEPHEIDAADEGSGDEEIEAAAAQEEVTQPVTKPFTQTVAKVQPPVRPSPEKDAGLEARPVAQPAPKAVSKPVPNAEESSDESQDAAPAKDTSGADSSVVKEAKPKGFVNRAFMTLSNLDELGPKVAEYIAELGGEKAGEVELGWKRGTGRYYHFALPEESEEKLLERLRALGPVRISKDPHPRIMPKGQVRFILWIEAAE